jgi:hypothetical protein
MERPVGTLVGAVLAALCAFAAAFQAPIALHRAAAVPEAMHPFARTAPRLLRRGCVRMQQDAAAATLKMHAFEAWMWARNVKAEHVSHAMFAAGGGQQRGVVANKDLAEGETICEIPRAAALCLIRGDKAYMLKSTLDGDFLL